MSSTLLNFTSFHNVINGELRSSTTGKTRSTVNPATLEDNPPVPVAGLDNVNDAVQSARKAAKAWAQVPWEERRKALNAFADAVEANLEGFAQMSVKELGKPVNLARFEVTIAIQSIRVLSGFSLPEQVREDSESRKVITRYTPLGVAAGIIPWNFPISVACVKTASALATGNAIILKPSPHAPYGVLKLAELGQQFFPPGVLQALSGDDELGPWLVQHPDINVIAFTGSIAVGKKVMEGCSKTLKRCILELGGNDAAIVCSDVDVEAITPKLGYFAFANCGQVCIIPKRIYAHESIYDKLLAGLVNYAKNLSFKLDAELAIGPLSNKPQYEHIKQLLTDVETNKLTLATGSTKPLADQKGLYLTPTIIDNPPDKSRVVVEEAFGPVLPVLKWSDESDVVERVNDTKYGLGASVWSRDAEQADRIARQLEAGIVFINTHAETDANFPAGAFKESGIGVQYGVEGLQCYCNLQTIYRRLN
ncbi:aldehyde dehydrogenase [Daldinia eschscholtzii]|nr:aldehyde dehydrogenase [Daldinia eschscholtzii]